MFNVNSKVTQTTQHEILLSVSWIYEKWQTSVITRRFQTLIWKPRDMVQNLEWVDSTVHDWCNCNMNKKEFLLDWLSIFRPQGYLALVWMHQLTFSSAESSSLKQLDSLKIDMWMNQFLAINEFGFCRIWRINQIEEGVWPRWITPSEICLILHILQKPNSLIASLFIQNNS